MTPAITPAAELGTLRTWFELAPEALLAIDAGGYVVLANALAERLFGYAPAALHGLPLATLLVAPHAWTSAAQHEPVSAMVDAQLPGTVQELTGVRRDDAQFVAEACLRRIDAGPAAVVVVALRDVSLTRRVLRTLARERHDAFITRISQLVLESADHESAIRSIPQLVADALEVPAVAVLSSDWHRNSFRIRAAAGLTSITAEALTAIFGNGELHHRAFANGERAPITSAEPAGEIATAIRAGLTHTRYHDFVVVSLFGRYEPLGILIALAAADTAFDSDKLAFLQAVASLLTATVQRSHAEEQLAHAQRLDAVGQLTGGIAHDFNNLLTVVSGNLQLLDTELHDRPQTREIIDSALHAVDRGAELTRKLLTFARRQALRPRAIKLEPLLTELGQMLQRTLGETIAIQVECPAGAESVYADPSELDTALVNLALNARDAMPRGGRLNIAARGVAIDADGNEWALAPGRYVVIRVDDTGTGMAQDVQARACEPFFTTKVVGQGSGLGLSMVYGFVTQSGGRMQINSRLGYGTRVEIFLPVAAVGLPAAAERPHAARADAHSTILVVEDEAEVRNIAATFLRAMGHTVLTAGTADEALRILTTRPRIDLLFSDVVLGGATNGVELANAARRTHPKLAVLLTSGYLGAGSVAPDAAQSSSYRLLRKPYRREQLAAAVGATLAESAATVS